MSAEPDTVTEPYSASTVAVELNVASTAARFCGFEARRILIMIDSESLAMCRHTVSLRCEDTYNLAPIHILSTMRESAKKHALYPSPKESQRSSKDEPQPVRAALAPNV